jgi:hypothetical protein
MVALRASGVSLLADAGLMAQRCRLFEQPLRGIA